MAKSSQPNLPGLQSAEPKPPGKRSRKRGESSSNARPDLATEPAQKPGKHEAGKSPPAPDPKKEPVKAFLAYLSQYPVLGTFGLLLGAGFWQKLGSSRFGDYLLAVGASLFMFLVCHRIFPSDRFFRVGLPAFLSVITFIALPSLVEKAQRLSEKSTTTNAVAWNPPPAPTKERGDKIEGTDFTHAELEAIFRFGYAIITDRNGTFERVVRHPKFVAWKLPPLDTIIVERDFGKMEVHWELPALTAGRAAAFEMFGYTAPLDTNAAFLVINLEGQPNPYVATLSNDPFFPVYLIGFRRGREPAIKLR